MTENAPFFVDREVIVLNKNGLWIADDTEITHEQTCRLFSKNLKKDEKGYFIQVGRETKRIIVEDTAYFVQRIDGDPVHGYQLWMSDESREKLDPKSLQYRPGRLTCKVKSGQEEARFLHAPYFDLLKDLEEDKSGYFLKFGTPQSTIRIDLAKK